jgi:RNA-binding protein YhbY
MKERIENAQEGTIFINSDFIDITNAETIRRNLNRFAKTGIIRRVLNGVFEKPKYSALLEEYVAVDPDAVAKALARNYHWTIAPSGNTALNLLGLSTQVPAVWSYISDGPYRSYEWNSTKIIFKNRANKEITRLSYMTILVIQSLKTIGKKGVTPEIITRLSNRLNVIEKSKMLQEATEATDWVYNTIKEICGDVEYD